MANATKAIELFKKEAHKYLRRIEMVNAFEKDNKALYELELTNPGTKKAIGTVLVNVIGYITESIQVKFIAGEGGIAHELNNKGWRFQRRSIKYENIKSWEKVTLKDLPIYVGCNETSEELSKFIKGMSANG